jgi:threonine 3-dehydrogenase
MKALVKAYPKEGLWLQDMLVPEVGPEDVLIRIKKKEFAAPISISGNGTNGRRKRCPCP